MVEKKTGEGSESKESHLGTLLIFLGIFSGIWFGLIQILIELIRIQSIVFDASTNILVWIILFFSYFIFVYNLSIIKAIFFETFFYGWPEINPNKLASKSSKAYEDVMSGWALNVITIIPIFLVTIYRQVIGDWAYIVGIILIVFLVIEGYLYLIKPLLRKNYRLDFLGNFTSKAILGHIRTVSLGIAFIIFYCTVLVALTSGVDIKLDKERYSTNDTVIIQVQPYGIIPPKIEYLSYSNENIIIYNGTNMAYPASKRIIQIPHDVLTDKLYNSYLLVKTNYIYDIGNVYVKIVYVYRPID